MKLTEARSILNQVSGKSHAWMKAWGLSYVNEAIRTIRQRKSSTDQDNHLADIISEKIHRAW